MTRLALKLYFMLRFFFPGSVLCYSACERLTTIGQFVLFPQHSHPWAWCSASCNSAHFDWTYCAAGNFLLHWNMSWNHMLASCLWAPGEAISTLLAGQGKCCPNQTVPKIVCEIWQGCSSTQKPKQDESNEEKLKHCSSKTVRWAWYLPRPWGFEFSKLRYG